MRDVVTRKKRAVNLSIDETLIKEARHLAPIFQHSLTVRSKNCFGLNATGNGAKTIIRQQYQ